MSDISNNKTHWVNQNEWNPDSVTKLTAEQERYYQASQWQLMWWKFRKHRVALISGIFLVAVYLSLFFSEFLNPYNPNYRHTDYLYMPPQEVHFTHEGNFIGPFVYGTKGCCGLPFVCANRVTVKVSWFAHLLLQLMIERPVLMRSDWLKWREVDFYFPVM